MRRTAGLDVMPDQEALMAAIARAGEGRPAFVCAGGRAPDRLPAPPEAVLPHLAWVDPAGDRWLGVGAAATWEAAAGENGFALPDAARAAIEGVMGPAAVREGLRVIGGLAFAASRAETPFGTATPVARFVLPAWCVHPGGVAVVLAVEPGAAPADLLAALEAEGERLAAWLESEPKDPALARAELVEAPEAYSRWASAIGRMLEAIEAGLLEKAVLARPIALAAPEAIAPWPLFSALAAAAPGTHRFLFRFEAATTFLGASPEVLFAQAGDRLSVDALAGTAPRHPDPREDDRLAEGLLASVKDRHEQAVVVEMVAEAIAPLAEALTVPENPVIKRLATVQHLHTPVSARLREGVSLEALLTALHPTPAVGGRPRAESLALIAKLEPFARGWYAGPVGLIGPATAEFAVAIRSAYLEGERAAVMAGCGIVKGSEPLAEWAETLKKAAPLVRLLTEAAP